MTPDIITLDITSASSYQESLKKLYTKGPFTDCYLNFNNPNNPIKDHKILCPYSIQYKNYFTIDKIVEVMNNNAVVLRTHCRPKDLYVYKVTTKNDKIVWGSDNRGKTSPYSWINNNCQDLVDVPKNNYQNQGFFSTLKQTVSATDSFDSLTKFFKTPRNIEKLWVFTAEAIRFPTVFESIFMGLNQGGISYHTLHYDWLSNWDKLSKEAWIGYIKEAWIEYIKNNKPPKFPNNDEQQNFKTWYQSNNNSKFWEPLFVAECGKELTPDDKKRIICELKQLNQRT